MLSTLPPEILEEIGFAAVALSFSFLDQRRPTADSAINTERPLPLSPAFLGPPASLVPLLLTCRRLHACLCTEGNPVLYARIFELQFDSNIFSSRRLSSMQDAQILAQELKRRWTVLGRMRAGIGSKFIDAPHYPAREHTPKADIENLVSLNRETLYTAYVLMLENTSGKNVAQLCGYANAEAWLRAFLFSPEGASGADRSISNGAWPLAEVPMNASDDNLYFITTETGEQLFSGDAEANTLALWLFWFLFRAEDYPEGQLFHRVTSILKLFALAAHHFPLTSPSWADFIPISHPTLVPKMSTPLPSYYPPLVPPPAATPAILAFLALVGSPSVGIGGLAYAHVGRHSRVTSSITTTEQEKQNLEYARPWMLPAPEHTEAEWETEWGRCIRGGRFRIGNHHALGKQLHGSKPTAKVDISSVEPVFKRGSAEGVWEGMFTYLEFTAYSALLSGSPPGVLQRSLVVRHRQTWRLREWWLIANEDETTVESELQDSWFGGGIDSADSGVTKGGIIDGDVDGHVQLKRAPQTRKHEDGRNDAAGPTSQCRLAPGPALRSYIPLGTRLTESAGGSELEVYQPSVGMASERQLIYQRAATSDASPLFDKDMYEKHRVRDVIITGEGHSAWGQFSLAGRVRPYDGFVCLTKEYTDGDRGRWLYRGFLAGDSRRTLAGRWRDTLSPAEVQGYEGCFTMARRQ